MANVVRGQVEAEAMGEALGRSTLAALPPVFMDAGAEAASCNEGNRPAKARSEPSTKAVLSLAQALATSGTLEDAVYTAAADALTRRGAALDAAEVSGAPQAWRSWKDQSRPHVLSEQPDICILWKPAGWTVSIDSEEDPWGSASLNSSASAGTGGRQLQDWVVAQLGPSFRISVDAGAGYGLVHRLDRDTSGAIVCATSYRGYFLAQLQCSSQLGGSARTTSPSVTATCSPSRGSSRRPSAVCARRTALGAASSTQVAGG
eukprot:CAMPEP_0180545552 /NCGR_PEP_ID=MMETSP1036_2-20121128/70098_1 /TAXON_ID=632150 /ORGANISM="Azadinium spinosum, Strain 3D9" /LENGTH=260 /DNA_ID=CAMNT_0022560597 /DNA_START=442 /DNA_END=1220 /DNA_ORIENTATION=-